MLATFSSLPPALGWSLLPSPGEDVSLLGRGWAVRRVREPQDQLWGSGGEKARTGRAEGSRQAAVRNPESASGTHQSRQWRCPAGRQHACKRVHAGECGSAAKCFYRDFSFTVIWTSSEGKGKTQQWVPAAPCRPLSFASLLFIFKWRPLNCHCWQTETQMGASCQAQAESPAFSRVLN